MMIDKFFLDTKTTPFFIFTLIGIVVFRNIENRTLFNFIMLLILSGFISLLFYALNNVAILIGNTCVMFVWAFSIFNTSIKLTSRGLACTVILFILGLVLRFSKLYLDDHWVYFLPYPVLTIAYFTSLIYGKHTKMMYQS